MTQRLSQIFAATRTSVVTGASDWIKRRMGKDALLSHTAASTGNALSPAAKEGLGADALPVHSPLYPVARFIKAKQDEAALKMAGSPVLALGPVVFAAPWMLLGLLTLPALWWLMKTVPPKPLQMNFPAIRMLFNLKSQDQEPAKMPLWQRLMRLTAVALVVLGLSQPTLNPEQPLSGTGPVVLVVDNGWASAPNWDARVRELNAMIDRAEGQGRPIVLLPTARPEDGGPVNQTGPISADDARRFVATLKPQPWPVDRQAAAESLATLELTDPTTVVWLSNGLNDSGAAALTERLQQLGTLRVLEDAPQNAAQLLSPPAADGSDALTITIRRPDSVGERTLTLTASDEAGRAVAQADATFAEGQTETTAVFNLPLEVRNQLTRVSIEGENSAGATVLLDERWRRRPVGVVMPTTTESAQPLLNEFNYIERALDPYVDLSSGTVDQILSPDIAVLVLPDSAALTETEQQRIAQWVANGGTLLRFAGPRLASEGNGTSTLLPVELRPGERILGGQMSGEEVGRFAPFEQGSPFYGIRLPTDVTIRREVMPQPSANIDDRTWARLQDGTPIVTANQNEQGWIVLFHTTANTDWSNLAISGLFVDMLRAVVGHSQGVKTGLSGPSVSLPAIQTLDGQGRLIEPSGAVRPLTREAIDGSLFGPQNPPGFYGNESARHAHNLASGVPELTRLSTIGEGTLRQSYIEAQKETDLRGPFLGAAMSLALLDLIVLLGQRGALPSVRRRRSPTPA